MRIVDAPSVLPDFVKLHDRFQTFSRGAKAELRRVAHLDQVAMTPAYYRWISGYLPSLNLERIAFLMPFATHADNAEALGRQLFKRQISESRLFQMLRSESPRDLEHLRRLLRHLDQPALNWEHFGRTLYYWGDNSKRRILQDYFTTIEISDQENRDA